MSGEAASSNGGISRSRAIWPFNLIATLLLLFLTVLMVRSRETYFLAVGSFTVALACSYASIRIRFNLGGLVLLIIVASFYASFLHFYLPKA